MYDDSQDRARAADWRKNKAEGDRFKLQEGTNVFRILKTPPDKEAGTPGLWTEYNMHGDVGPKKRFIRCGKNFKGRGECWICDELIPKLQRKGKSELATALAPKPQLGLQVAVVDDKGKMRGPKTFSISSGQSKKSFAFKIMGVVTSQKRDYLDHKKGHNITVERSGTGRNDTTYDGPFIDPDRTPVPASIVEELKPFSQILPKYDEETQKNAYFGREDSNDRMGTKDTKKKKSRDEEEEVEEEEIEDDDDAEEEDEDEDDRPKKKKKVKAGKKAKKSKDDDEDEEDDDESEDDEDEEEDEEDEEEDEDDEDEKPSKKSKAKKGKKSKKSEDDDEDEDEEEESDDEDEEDEEEEEEDEDDEDEKPKSKKAKASKKSKKKSKDDDDEDEEEEDEEDSDDDEDSEEEDEDEEEEEERPKKKTKKKVRK